MNELTSIELLKAKELEDCTDFAADVIPNPDDNNRLIRTMSYAEGTQSYLAGEKDVEYIMVELTQGETHVMIGGRKIRRNTGHEQIRKVHMVHSRHHSVLFNRIIAELETCKNEDGIYMSNDAVPLSEGFYGKFYSRDIPPSYELVKPYNYRTVNFFMDQRDMEKTGITVRFQQRLDYLVSKGQIKKASTVDSDLFNAAVDAASQTEEDKEETPVTNKPKR